MHTEATQCCMKMLLQLNSIPLHSTQIQFMSTKNPLLILTKWVMCAVCVSVRPSIYLSIFGTVCSATMSLFCAPRLDSISKALTPRWSVLESWQSTKFECKAVKNRANERQGKRPCFWCVLYQRNYLTVTVIFIKRKTLEKEL